MHEFVCQGRSRRARVQALDICKRLIDYGFHPPTSYFPLIVPEALMIEPTETESRETLDAFVEALERIAAEAVDDPALLTSAPHDAPIGASTRCGRPASWSSASVPSPGRSRRVTVRNRRPSRLVPPSRLEPVGGCVRGRSC